MKALDKIEAALKDALALVRLGPLTKHEHQELDSLVTRAVNAVPDLLALRAEVAELKREKGHWGFGVQPLHWLNEAEVYDAKSELIMRTAPIRLAIMQGGEVSDRDRALCQAVEDLDAAIKRFVERVHSEAARAAFNQEPGQ